MSNPDLPNCVLGFLFNPNKTKVLLVLKNRPAFLAGLYNGIGGKCEKNESFKIAMAREFMEETGIDIYFDRWINFCSMSVTSANFKGSYIVECFKCFAVTDKEFMSFKTMTDEPIVMIDANELPSNIVPNLKWMIPLSINNNVRKSSVIYRREDS